MANVIKTVLTYPLDGSNRDFNIPFEYLARKFVVVTLIGVDRKVLTLNTDYRFATRTTISLTKAWGTADGYTTIELRRVTSTTDRLVDFTDGSILRAYDLNVAQIQTMHVAEEARDLTADTIGVNSDGHLDARGRRIVNLANAVDDRDAVPFGQLRSMNQNSWQARNEAQGFRNEAEQFRNQAETFKNNAASSASASAQSASESAGSASAAKVSESNANNSKNAAAASQSAAATSEMNAKTSETNAKSSEAKAKASETNAKASETVIVQNVASYGSLPIGSVIMTVTSTQPSGFLPLDGSTFDADTYPALYAYLKTNVLPDYRNRYVKMGASLSEVGSKGGFGLPAMSGSALEAGLHTHSNTVSTAGNHTHTGTANNAGEHQHKEASQYSHSFGNPDRMNANYWGPGKSANILTASAGAHTHTLTINAAGDHTHTVAINNGGAHVHQVTIPAQGTGKADMEHVKVWYWIKAFGTTDAEQMVELQAALTDIRTASNNANVASNTVAGYDSRLSLLEGEYLTWDNAKVQEYLDLSGTTQLPRELLVRVTGQFIHVKGIIRREIKQTERIFMKLKKAPTGFSGYDIPYTPALTNISSGAGMYLMSYTERANGTGFPASIGLASHRSSDISWIMVDMIISFYR